MAHVAHFKFPDTNEDTIPTDLASSITSAATLKALLVDLYTNRGGEAACGTGKLIFGEVATDENQCVLLVSALIIQWDGVSSGNHILLFHLVNVSTQFQVV